ncbi:MAG TPA: redoxin domain-containing protein [Acidiferrobacterales bacterium]|jgi:peroxiredoxin
MRYAPGDKPPAVDLPGIDGTRFSTESLAGRRFMLSFFRFAACPFCNLRVHELVTRFAELGDGFTVVAIFDSPLDNLKRNAGRQRPPFPMLADEGNVYHRLYGVERSFLGLLKGAILRLPSVLYGVVGKGYVPLSFKGHLATLPADLLVDERGVVRVAHYGSDPGDHLPFERVKAFALGS